MPNLSVIIVARNEAGRIRACLESVRWADEIIVVDSGSSDGTPELCRQYTKQVYLETDWQGFGVQKNRALDRAGGEWVLSIDADEQVTPELRAEMLQAIQTTDCNAWSVPRLSAYCGRMIRHGDWGGDRVVRLFRRGTARFSSSLVHERLETTGNVGRLRSHLLHYPFANLEQVLDKLNSYSSAGAAMRAGRKGRVGLSSALLHGLWAFVRGYVFRLGFLDGREGFILAFSNAEGVYYRYLKLMYLQERDSEPEE